VAVVVIVVAACGCSLLSVSGPGTRQPGRAPVCDTSPRAPVLVDALLALLVAGAFLSTIDPDKEMSTGDTVGAIAVGGGLFVLFATRDIDEALRAERPGRTTSAASEPVACSGDAIAQRSASKRVVRWAT
jgi:hypothetical protein